MPPSPEFPASAKRPPSASSSNSKTSSTTSPSPISPRNRRTTSRPRSRDDALSALVNLGYPRPVAQKAIDTAIEKNPPPTGDFETLFRAAMAAIR